MQCIKLMTASQARLGLCTASLQQWAIRLVLAIVGGSSLAPQLLLAQTVAKFPDKSIRFVVPFPPGGGNDILARAIAPRLAEAFGQTVVVDNRAGAGGNIATDFLIKAPPDGHTIMLGTIFI